MTFIPPTSEPFQPHVRLLTDGMLPNFGDVSPNAKQAVWTNPGNTGFDRSFVITVIWLHNTDEVDIYSCAWASSHTPFQVYSPSADPADQGTDDPGIELGSIDLEPRDIAVFTDPITIYPGESFYGIQNKKGSVPPTGRAIMCRLYGHWEPLV
jgi:hypothetical protein